MRGVAEAIPFIQALGGTTPEQLGGKPGENVGGNLVVVVLILEKKVS